MDESEQYKLRWRGREFGPLSIEEINHKLDQHEIGMGHEIYFEEKWMTIEEFFVASKSSNPASPPLAKSVPQSPLGRSFGPPPGQVPAAQTATLPAQPGGLVRPTAPPGSAGMLPMAAESEPSASPPPRRRLVFALLAVLLGFSGAHNYYSRQWLTGLLQLLLSVATFLLGFGIIASWIWALIEAVIVRRDASGQEMT